MKKIILGLLISAFFFSGCAFGTRKPILSYTPILAVEEAKNIAIYIKPFEDHRTEQSVIGHVRNGYGMKTAKVVTETSVSEWATNAIKAELTNSGYKIVDEKEADLNAIGEILSVYCDSYLSYEGKVMLGFLLKRGEETLIDKKYSGEASALNVLASSKGYGSTLEKALQDAIHKIVNDINWKLKNDKSETIKN